MKIPLIKDIRTFTTMANIYGYTYKNQYCVKSVVFNNRTIEIKINLFSGKIAFKFYIDDISCDLTLDDKKYFLRDIDYLIKWVDIECLKEEL